MLARRRGLIMFGFGVYAGLAFMLTHWPQLTIPIPGRPDLVAHMGLFGLWTIMCTLSGLFGPALSELNVWRSVGISIVYSGVDEGSQAIPFIRRVCALDDFGANALGVITAGAALLLAARVAGSRRK